MTGEPSRDQLLRRLRKLHPQWPSYLADSGPAAEKAWFALDEDGRREAEARMLDYVAAVKEQRLKLCTFGVFLSERRWTKLPPRAPEPERTHSSEAPFGKGWGALRFSELCGEPGPLPPPTAFIRRLIEAGGPDGERERLAHLARHGWPLVNRMHAQAAERRGFSVPVGLLPLGEAFRQVRVGRELWEAWRRAHEARGWPWLPEPGGLEWVWMPAGEDPERAIGDFEAALRAGQAAGEMAEEAVRG